MLPTAYLESMKKKTLAYQTVRRDVIKLSGDALHHAKKAIFAMHRAELKDADAHIKQARTLLTSLTQKHKKTPKIKNEGAYKAAIEELVEATLLRQFLAKKKLTKLTGIAVADDVYIAGLADVPGELYRYALKAGTEQHIEEVDRAQTHAAAIVEALIDFDLTKHLRVKFDQAKSSLHKIERVAYELHMSKKYDR